MIRVATMLACAAFVAGCGQTSGSGTAMALRGYAYAPPAFNAFCAREKALCSTKGDARVVELTGARRQELAAVNATVNRRVAEKSDYATGGKADSWGLPGKEGDCEDFAILKKAELIKRGWPASALLLTVVTSGGEGHTILTVRTSEGDLVLDNRTLAVRNWSRTSYRYFARQSQSDGRKWDRIG